MGGIYTQTTHYQLKASAKVFIQSNKMSKLDYSVTQKLKNIRERLGLTQAQVAELFFEVERKTYAHWENANASPHETHRMNMLCFLLEDSILGEQTWRIEELWTELMQSQWGWDILTAAEKWILRVFRERNVPIGKPQLPPDVVSHDLVGREETVANLRTMVTTRERVSLTGMPGVGKTAIIAALAKDPFVRQHFKDGVLWAGLGQESDVDGWLIEWANVLGRDLQKLANAKARAKVIRNAIGDKRILLIIDDAWDIDDANLLCCGGPNCCHILTSRNQSIAEGFATPKATILIPELSKEAGFALMNNLAPSACSAYRDRVEELINVVGCLPLAIVLLGGFLATPENARPREATEQAIKQLTNIEQRLSLAQQRLGAHEDTQLTLQEVIALSIETLPTKIVESFYALGAFAPKPAFFDGPAAQHIVQCDIHEIGILLDRNLLEITSTDFLLLHQVLTDYARTKTELAAYERHREYYLARINTDRQNWREIDAFYPQLRWAWQYQSKHSPQNKELFAFLEATDIYHHRRGLWEDYLEWSEVALKFAREQANLDQVASLLTRRAVVYEKLGDRPLALELHKEALELRVQLKDMSGQARVLHNIATVFQQMANHSEALGYAQRALAIFESLQELPNIASVLNSIGLIYTDYSEPEEALDCLDRALTLHRQLDNKDGEATLLINIAAVYIEMMDNHSALKHLTRALTIANRIGNREIEGKAYHNQGTVHFKNGNVHESIACVEKAREIWHDLDHRPDEASALYSLATFYRATGQKDKALDAYHDALAIQQEVVDRFGELHSLGFIGILHEEVENWETALAYYNQGAELAKELHDRRDEAALLQKIADVLYRLREFQQALQYYERALNLALEHGVLQHERGLRISISNVYRHLQQFDEAIQQMERVVEIGQMINHPDLDVDSKTLEMLRREH